MSISCVASAPGKIILAGEHAVVHGCSAIATVIDKRTFVHFTTLPEGTTVELDIIHPILGRKLSWSLATLQSIVNEAKVPLTQAEPPSQSVYESCRRLLQPLEGAAAGEIIMFLTQIVCLYGARTALRVVVTTDLPTGAGLGSSASYGASIVAGLLFLRSCQAGVAVSPSCTCDTRISSIAVTKKPETKTPSSPTSSISSSTIAQLPRHPLCSHEKALVNSFVYEGERVFHGTPSGLDNTVCTYGGVIVFKRPATFEFLTKFPPGMRLLVTNTRVEHNTKELVAGVTRLVKSDQPDKKFNAVGAGLLAAMEGISEEYKTALLELQNNNTVDNEKKFVDLAISRFPINHHLLCAVGVSHPSIDQVIRLTSEFNLPSKITGAGGGGCVISIITPEMTETKLRDFTARVTAMGMETFECSVGQHGVVIHADL